MNDQTWWTAQMSGDRAKYAACTGAFRADGSFAHDGRQCRCGDTDARYVVVESTPGYMPEDDDPAWRVTSDAPYTLDRVVEICDTEEEWQAPMMSTYADDRSQGGGPDGA